MDGNSSSIMASPSNSSLLSTNDISVLIEKANSGDVGAMERLFDYYAEARNDIPSSIYWLEKIGDSGNKMAREGVVGYYKNLETEEGKKRAELLRRKWNM